MSGALLEIKDLSIAFGDTLAVDRVSFEIAKGEIFALIHTVGKPNDLFVKNKNDAGLKFLPVPYDKFDDLYVPSVFTAEDYPGYVKPGEKNSILKLPLTALLRVPEIVVVAPEMMAVVRTGKF